MNKQWLLGLSMSALFVVGIVWLSWPQPRIGPANFERIHQGMSQGQIEAIIGLPPGNYYTCPPGNRSGVPSHVEIAGLCRLEKGRPLAEQTGRVISWWGNDYAIEVSFDKSGRAERWYHIEVVPVVRGPTFIDRIRGWLGW